jgi:sugar phosphate isomerase/epimerase
MDDRPDDPAHEMRDELIATCWTHAGDARPLRGDERSPLAILDRVAAVAETGWQGIGFIAEDLRRASETIGLAELRAQIAAAGLRYTEIELAIDWWKNDAAARAHRRFLVHAAAELGARSIKAAGSMEEHPPDAAMVDGLRALASEAEAAGAFVLLEPFPFSNISSVPRGADLVRAADHANLGLMVDAWHVFRAGTTLDELRAAVPPALVRGVELDDALGPVPHPDELFADTADRRLLPGEGDFDLIGFVRLMIEFGFSGPWGVEIISEQHRALPVDVALTSAITATRTVLDAARRRVPVL